MKGLEELMKRKDAGQSLGLYKLTLVSLSDNENAEVYFLI